MQYKTIELDKLEYFLMRGIRTDVVNDLKERIGEKFNPARPLSVMKKEDKYIVVDGNHRLKAMQELGIKEVPCLIREGDPYKLAIESNTDEETFAPMDLFDWLGVIDSLRNEGLTQQAIGDKVEMSRGAISNYILLLDKIATPLLESAKQHQKGRVSKNATNVALHNFTEGWFRNSGLYDLDERYQEKLMNDFIADKCNWNNGKVKRESAKYKQWLEFIEVAKDKLVNPSNLNEIVLLIEGNTFRNEQQLLAKIQDFNNKAENKLINGDCLIELENLQDSTIDLVITDPPYGIDYSSNYSKYNDYVTKENISNDSDLKETLDLMEQTLNILDKKMKADSHLYLFTSWKVYPEFVKLVSKHFDIKNMIVWNKGNASMGDLEGSWGNQHELIIFATKGRRTLNTRKFDIININRVPTTKAIHPTQKPEEVIKVLLEASAHTKDTVIDPFMGSGSTIKAVKEYGDLNYIGIELDKDRFDKAVSYIGVD